MTEERIAELRAMCAEYERNKAIDEKLGHGDQAADIAADGVGRRALEALPELLDELELVDCLSIWLANAYIDPCLLPDIGRNDIETPQPEDVIAYAKECIHGES